MHRCRVFCLGPCRPARWRSRSAANTAMSKAASLLLVQTMGRDHCMGAGNFVPYQGQYSVEEGFLEVDAPLLKNQYVQSLDLNAAGRFTDYSTSGAVQTWKLGSDQPGQ